MMLKDLGFDLESAIRRPDSCYKSEIVDFLILKKNIKIK